MLSRIICLLCYLNFLRGISSEILHDLAEFTDFLSRGFVAYRAGVNCLLYLKELLDLIARPEDRVLRPGTFLFHVIENPLNIIP